MASRSPCIRVQLTEEEEATLTYRVACKTRQSITGSRCEACNKILEESEGAIRGYASGQELGLCRKCASHVNTPEAIAKAERLGARVHAKPIIHTPGTPTGYTEVELHE